MASPTAPELRATLEARTRREQGVLDAERDSLRARLPAAAVALRRLGATRVWAFGSLVWGGWHVHSDVDLAAIGVAASDIVAAEDAASVAMGRPVELFRLEELPRGFADRIAHEGLELAP